MDFKLKSWKCFSSSHYSITTC